MPIVAHIPPWFQGQQESTVPKPQAILDRRFVKHQNKAITQYLVQREGFDRHEASWENAEDFDTKYPDFMQSQT